MRWSRPGARRSEIDLIIVATSTPDMVFPSTATILQHKLGVAGCPAFDLAGRVLGLRLRADGGRFDDPHRRGVPRAGGRQRSVLAHPRLQRPHAPACCSATAPVRWCSRPAISPAFWPSDLHADGALSRHPVHAGHGGRRQGARRSAVEDGRAGGVQAGRQRARGIGSRRVGCGRPQRRTTSTG